MVDPLLQRAIGYQSDADSQVFVQTRALIGLQIIPNIIGVTALIITVSALFLQTMLGLIAWQGYLAF